MLRLVSLATVAFLALQLAAAVTKTNATWPVAGFPMFREKRTSFIRPGIVLTFPDGRQAEAQPSDFNLTQHQYRAYMLEEIVGNDGKLKPNYDRRVEAMARVYVRAKGDREAAAVELFEDEYPFDTPDTPIRHAIATVALK